MALDGDGERLPSAFLQKLRRYGPPTPDEIAGLEACFGNLRTFHPGQEVIRQGSTPTESTLLLEGMMGRVVNLRRGVQQTTALQITGDFVDLHGFLLSDMDHSVVALTDCRAMSIAHSDLRQLSDRFPRLARSMWRLTLVDAAVHRQWMVMIGRRRAAGGLAHLLCELHTRLADVGLAKGAGFTLPLTQAQIGEILSLSAVHVNRMIRTLRARALVNWERDQIVILNWDGLAALAEFDPGYLQLNLLPGA